MDFSQSYDTYYTYIAHLLQHPGPVFFGISRFVNTETTVGRLTVEIRPETLDTEHPFLAEQTFVYVR